jgi:hypothetical protein
MVQEMGQAEVTMAAGLVLLFTTMVMMTRWCPVMPPTRPSYDCT